MVVLHASLQMAPRTMSKGREAADDLTRGGSRAKGPAAGPHEDETGSCERADARSAGCTTVGPRWQARSVDAVVGLLTVWPAPGPRDVRAFKA